MDTYEEWQARREGIHGESPENSTMDYFIWGDTGWGMGPNCGWIDQFKHLKFQLEEMETTT